MTDSKNLRNALSMVAALVADVGDLPDNQRFPQAREHCMTALAELELVLHWAHDEEFAYNRSLVNLIRALDESLKRIQDRIADTIDVPNDNGDPEAHDAFVTEQMQRREAAGHWLEQAQLSASKTIMFMGKALDALGTPNPT